MDGFAYNNSFFKCQGGRELSLIFYNYVETKIRCTIYMLLNIPCNCDCPSQDFGVPLHSLNRNNDRESSGRTFCPQRLTFTFNIARRSTQKYKHIINVLKERITTMNKTTFLASLAFAFSLAASAQSYNEYNKRELLLQVLDQSRPNDYVPVFFNVHFADKFGDGAVASHIKFYEETNVDFVNVKYEYIPSQKVEFKTADDFKKVKDIPVSELAAQLNVVTKLALTRKQGALILPTVYSPLAVLSQIAGGWEDKQKAKDLIELIRKNPQAAAPALDKVTKILVTYIREARKNGADGFYISSQGADVTRFAANGVFDKYIKPYDRQLSDVANEIAPINILHICEAGGKFNLKALESYKDYPGSIVNVPIHEFEGEGYSLKQLQDIFKRPILGGFTRTFIDSHSVEESKAVVDQILKDAPANFILGADDSVLPNSSDLSKLRAVVDYAHSWRQTHK